MRWCRSGTHVFDHHGDQGEDVQIVASVPVYIWTCLLCGQKRLAAANRFVVGCGKDALTMADVWFFTGEHL